MCVDGARRLRHWVEGQKLPLNPCGKVIVPQRSDLDPQLDLLAERGRANGAVVELWDSKQLRDLIPEARSSSGRALWSPNTAVVKPITVVRRLQQVLSDKGVRFLHGCKDWNYQVDKKVVKLSNGLTLCYGHLFNCTGLQADRVAHQFEVGIEYSLLPFKGLYWKLKPGCPIEVKANLYPVPDLNVPFLGVHFTPSADAPSTVSIGPTATVAFGRENYKGLEAVEPAMAAANMAVLLRQYLSDQGGFRRYVHEQAFLALPPDSSCCSAVDPSYLCRAYWLSEKVGIRSQLFNHSTQRLEDDFLCLPGPNSTHVLNAISQLSLPVCVSRFDPGSSITNFCLS